MELSVRLFAVLAERAGADRVLLPCATGPDGLCTSGGEPLTVGRLKAELAAQHPDLGDLGFASGVVGTAYVPDERRLLAEDEVALLPPVSGGEDFTGGVFELSAESLDPGQLGRRVVQDSTGALVTFTGLTRNKNRGQSVVQLDYEAFAEMVGPEMERIFARCRETIGPPSADGDPELELHMLCAHRTGVVPVGEPSVVVAVASPHRDAAFRAARFLIDTLKESLPVWKKEHYADGHHWIGDRS